MPLPPGSELRGLFTCRSPLGLSRSPWAVKKINSKCNRSQQSIYQERLNEEAKVLRTLQHPNIVGELLAQPRVLESPVKVVVELSPSGWDTRLLWGCSWLAQEDMQSGITVCLPHPYALGMGCWAAFTAAGPTGTLLCSLGLGGVLEVLLGLVGQHGGW